jgi:carbonic anhydrase
VPAQLSAKDALSRLREGNGRFASNLLSVDSLLSYTRRAELSAGQQPFAIILGCSDSRVPAEIVFDQGIGDLFVIRVAGNVVAPSQIGSVEFAAARFGTRLVVVLGHSRCGAIQATVETLEGTAGPGSRSLRSIVNFIRPSVEDLMTGALASDHEALVNAACRANVLASVKRLRRGSPLIEQLVAEEGLRVVGAEYDLESGRVDFFDGAQ